MTNIKLLLLDSDSLFYQSCKSTLEESIQVFNEKLQNCLDKTECTHWIGFMGKSRKTFRTKIAETYKSNRGISPLKYLSVLKEWAAVEYKLNLCHDFEADDAVSYFYRKPIYYGIPKYNISLDGEFVAKFSTNTEELIDPVLVDKIIASPDKDILNSIEGVHFNYSYRIKEESKSKPKEELTEDDFNKGWFIETFKEDALQWPLYQLIVGDNSDGCSGLVGKGKVFFNKLEDKSYERVLREYIKDLGVQNGIYEFQKNYRLLHILEDDSDFIREVGYVPALPEIQVVIKPEIKEEF